MLIAAVYSLLRSSHVGGSRAVAKYSQTSLARPSRLATAKPWTDFLPCIHPRLSPLPRHRGISRCVIRPRLLAIMHAAQCSPS